MNAQQLPDSAGDRPDRERRRAAGQVLARAKAAALRRRATRIRRVIAGLAVTLFVAAFAVVYVQLASGHDPALTANERRRAASSSESTSRSSSAGSSSSGTQSSNGSESSASGSESSSGSSGGSSGSSGSEGSSSSSESAGSSVTTKTS
jgi:hypothetical protein